MSLSSKEYLGESYIKYDWKCDTLGNGEGMGIWVEEKALFNNLLSMTYLYPGIEKPIQCDKCEEEKNILLGWNILI